MQSIPWIPQFGSKNGFWAGVMVAGVLFGTIAIVRAMIPDGGGVIHAYYQNNGGTLRVVDNPATCRNNETALAWSQTGPQGAQGPQGPVGPQGDQGPQGVPGTNATSHAYEASNTHELPDDNNLVGLTLPPGRYVVWTNVDISGDENGDANTQCGMWTALDGVNKRFIFSPGDDSAIYSGSDSRQDQFFVSLMGTVTLGPQENQILAYCSPGGGGDNKALAHGQMIAMAVDAIN